MIREPYFIDLPPRGWYRADLKHLINVSFLLCFHVAGIGQSITDASARLTYFLLILATFVHLYLSQPVCTSAGPVHRTAWCLVSLLLYCLPTVPGLKTFVVIYFWTPAHLIFTLPSSISPTQFLWHFYCLLFTLRHRCVLFLKSMDLHGLSKVKYVTFLLHNSHI